MHTRFTIITKGLLLIATPLVIQAIFIGMLIEAQAEADNARSWAVHTKKVIALVEEIYRRLLEGYAGIRILAVSENPAIGRPFRDSAKDARQQIEELAVLISDNDSQKPRIDQAINQFGAFRAWLAAEVRLVHSGQRGKALDQLDQGAALLAAVRATIGDILAEEERLDDDRMARLHRSSVRQAWTIKGGGIAFLSTAVVLPILFLNGLIRRLAVLKDNARRFGEGRQLMPRLTGNDEIAQVDGAFHDMASSLEQQKQENEMFVYSVSHDLRSPLVNLQGFSEELSLSCRELRGLFQHEGIPAAVRHEGLRLMTENIDESIRYIQTAVGRLGRIIDALLRLSRAGRVEYQWQMVDLEAMIPKIIDALHDTITNQKAEVIVSDLPPAWGDPTALEQVFANLISNAAHYLDGTRPGTIEVGALETRPADVPPSFRVYYVKDNGLGIPEAYHNRVFTAFSRLQVNVPQGEGIGLALVARMVKRHGGTVWLESSPGVGTTIFVALPANGPLGERAQAAPPQPAALLSSGDQASWQPSPS